MGVCDGATGTLPTIACEAADAQTCAVPTDTANGATTGVCGADTTSIASGQTCNVACDTGTTPAEATVTCDGSTGTLGAITCNARRLESHATATKHVAFTIVVDESDMGDIDTALASETAQADLGTQLVTALGADMMGAVTTAVTHTAAAAHVVSSGTTTGATTTGNSDSGTTAAGVALPLLGVCVAAAGYLV